MKKPDKKEMLNLFFSAFLIIAFIVCAHFFNDFAKTLPTVIGSIVSVVIYAVFGLLLFYATRVGDGKAVKRFSPVTLIVLVIPTLYIIVAAVASGMPLHDVFADSTGGLSAIAILAAVAFGYGVPYTFLSGYETAEEVEVMIDDPKPFDGGIEADLLSETEEQTESQDGAEASDTTAENVEQPSDDN